MLSMTTSTRFDFGTISESRPPSPGGRVASSASDPEVDHDVTSPAHESPSNPEPTGQPANDVDPQMPSTCHTTPSNEHLNELAETPRWRKDLDDHFTNVFKQSNSSLAKRAIDDVVARALRIIERPTRAKIRGLALALCTHWMCMQFRCKNANVRAPEIVALVSRIADHLGRASVHAQKDFLDDLGYFCIEKLKLTWHWYVDVVIRGVLPMSRKNLFMRVMTVVAMITHLFHSGQLRYGAVLDGLGYIASMSPWPDAVAVMYALLHELGPKFALEQAVWYFIQRLLTELSSFTVDRVPVDPLCRLVSAIKTLVAEWQDRTRVTLYHTYAKGTPGNNQFHGYHSQI